MKALAIIALLVTGCTATTSTPKLNTTSWMPDKYSPAPKTEYSAAIPIVSPTVPPIPPKEFTIAKYIPCSLRYKIVIDNVSRKNLKDPDSALVKISEPVKAVHLAVKANGDKVFEYGDFVLVSVNAKNSYGGYTGYRDTTYYMRDKTIVLFTEADADFYQLASKCGKTLSSLKDCFEHPEQWKSTPLSDPLIK